MQTLPNRAKVQIGLPLSDIDVKTEHFQNFIAHWDKVLNSSEYIENKVTYAYIQDRVHLVVFDRDLTNFTISGYEDYEGISIDDINIQYTQFDSVQTLENCQNISFAGNIVKK